jgi:hypothetical protein
MSLTLEATRTFPVDRRAVALPRKRQIVVRDLHSWCAERGAGNLERMQQGVEAERAERLAVELSVLDECNISTLDVLGALAATGLKLVEDMRDDAFAAYEAVESAS